MNEIDALSGVVLGTYHSPAIEIELPLIEKQEKIKYKNRIIEKNTREYGEFCFAGDFHYGNKAFSENMMHAYLNFLEHHKNIPIGFMGDIIECAQLSRYIQDEAMNMDRQIEEFCADWRPFADRVKFSLWGNHEEREAKESKNTKLMKYLMLELGAEKAEVPPPQRGLHIIFKVGDKRYGAYVHHSRTNARVNRKLQLRRTGSQNVVSLIAHGHTHELAFVPRTYFETSMVFDRPQILVKRQYLLATGCFLKYPAYAEAGSYPLTEVGAPIIRFYADNYQIEEYDITTTYRKYLKADSAGAAGVVFDHADGGLKAPREQRFVAGLQRAVG